MSLYSLNKDILIKIISEIDNLKNYPAQEILKIKNNCILELRKRTASLSKSDERERKEKLIKGLKHFYRILCDLEDTERLSINFTIYDIKNNKTDYLVLSVTNNGDNRFNRWHDDAYITFDFGQDRISLTTSLKYFDCLFDTTLLVTEIVIFYSSNSIYAEMEKH